MAAAERKQGADESDLPSGGKQMTFAEHLEELRGHVLRSLLALLALCVVCWIFQDEIAYLVMWPYLSTQEWLKETYGREPSKLKFFSVPEGFFFHFKIALYGAAIVTMPYFLYEMWRFVSAGLYRHERRAVMRLLPVSFALFLLGVLFSYFVLIPVALRFLLGYGNPEYIQPDIRLEYYLSFFVMLCLLLGAVFQLPLLQVILARFGLVSAATQARRRKAFVMGAVVAAAVITPTGDAVTLSLVAVPMLILYEMGLLVARRVRPTARGAGAEAHAGP
ncbi:MAG: twin-arginine translocase subunit TatC [Planctomycetes bacterium]|nr:twin-arginine translocase subunit TatC [Planctomycetota bacterium]